MNTQPIPQPADSGLPLGKTGKRFVRSLEYELISSLVNNQYGGTGADFAGLLALPLEGRIPGLVKEFGLKRMHRMVKLMLQEFVYSIKLPKVAKLSDTGISVCACDLILAAYEDQLGLEDLILFFERTKGGKYGKFRGLLTHALIMDKLHQFRQERHTEYVRIRDAREAELKALGPVERTAADPTPLMYLFGDAGVPWVPLKKIS